MRDNNYLLKVLSVSIVPKIITFGLTLATIPVVLRNVGAAQYGMLIYIGSALSISEVLIDFGVSAAAGRRLAEIRTRWPGALRREIISWARLQAAFLFGGFVPMVLAAHFALVPDQDDAYTPLLAVAATTLGLRVSLNFLRPCLQSMLAFKSMAVLDTCESVLRSIGQLAASQILPNAMGLALAELATAITAACLAIILTIRELHELNGSSVGEAPAMGLRDRLRASTAFLLLRLSTRSFQELPLVLIGRLVGPELVGIIGAFRRLAEILTTPFLIVGNALAVRVNEIQQHGRKAMSALWETGMRISSTAIYIALLCNLSAKGLAGMLLPQSTSAPMAFAILSPLVLALSMNGMLIPMSDYLGTLRRRIALLSVLALLQVPVLWLSINSRGIEGALVGYVTTHIVLSAAYLLLAHYSFFGTWSLSLLPELVVFGSCCLGAYALTRILTPSLVEWLHSVASWPNIWLNFETLIVFNLIFAMGLVMLGSCRRYYLRRDFFNFSR
jgi:O-antigen/teichoic acid export membrane protein